MDIQSRELEAITRALEGCEIAAKALGDLSALAMTAYGRPDLSAKLIESYGEICRAQRMTKKIAGILARSEVEGDAIDATESRTVSDHG